MCPKIQKYPNRVNKEQSFEDQISKKKLGHLLFENVGIWNEITPTLQKKIPLPSNFSNLS